MLMINTLWDMFKTELKWLTLVLLTIVVMQNEEQRSLFLPTLFFVMLKQNKAIYVRSLSNQTLTLVACHCFPRYTATVIYFPFVLKSMVSIIVNLGV